MEALFLEREEELTSLMAYLDWERGWRSRVEFAKNINWNYSVYSPAIAHEAIGYEVIKRKQNERERERERETKTPNLKDLSQEEDADKEDGNPSFNQPKDVGQFNSPFSWKRVRRW